MRRALVAIALCLSASIAAGQISGTLVTTVVERASTAPLAYSTVTVVAIGRADSISRFTDDAGQALFARLAPGRYRVRARELGFTPADTVVELADSATRSAVVLLLRAIPRQLAAVKVQSQGVCRQPGFPQGDSTLAAVASQIRENAHRVQVLTAAYPFYYQRERRFIESRRLIQVDTGTYDSRRHPGYHVGRLVRAVRDVHGNRSLVFTLPTLQDLADTAFEDRHCFWYAGRDSGAIRIDVAPVASLSSPDIAAEFYLDPEHYVVRRARFHLTQPDRVNPLLKAQTVEVHYRELAPLVAVADSIVSTMEIAMQYQTTVRTEVEEDRLIAIYDANGLSPDTAAVVDADLSSIDLNDTSITTRDVRGRLVGEHNEPFAGARIEVVGLPIATVAGDSGQFDLRGVPSSAQTLFIRRIGYRPMTANLPATPTAGSASHPILVHLPTTSIVTLDPVVVQAQRTAAAYHQIGFDERRRTTRGFFLDAAQIARLGASEFHELAQRAPGFQYVRASGISNDPVKGPMIPPPTLRVEGDLSCDKVLSDNPNHHIGDDPTCTVCINYIADGQLLIDGSGTSPSLTLADIEAQYPPKTIAAVEIYRPSAAPPTVLALGGPECASIVIWTKKYLGLDR